MKHINVFDRQKLRTILDSKKNHFVKIGGELHLIGEGANSLYIEKDGTWTIRTLVMPNAEKGRMHAADIFKVLQ